MSPNYTQLFDEVRGRIHLSVTQTNAHVEINYFINRNAIFLNIYFNWTFH